MDLNKVYKKESKNLQQHVNLLDEHWLATYNLIREDIPELVKIYNIDKTGIYMKKIKSTYNTTLHNAIPQAHDDVFKNLIGNYFSIISRLIVFGNTFKFFHCDLNLTNFLADKKGNLILIDPDSFVFLRQQKKAEIKYKTLLGFLDLQELIFQRCRK